MKFRELSLILIFKGASLKLRGKVYGSCVRSCMMYASETWPMKKGHELMVERTEIRMVWWICGTSLRGKKTSAELRNRLGWFGHVERKLKRIG